MKRTTSVESGRYKIRKKTHQPQPQPQPPEVFDGKHAGELLLTLMFNVIGSNASAASCNKELRVQFFADQPEYFTVRIPAQRFGRLIPEERINTVSVAHLKHVIVNTYSKWVAAKLRCVTDGPLGAFIDGPSALSTLVWELIATYSGKTSAYHAEEVSKYVVSQLLGYHSNIYYTLEHMLASRADVHDLIRMVGGAGNLQRVVAGMYHILHIDKRRCPTYVYYPFGSHFTPYW